jgi:hypothetical protein
MEDSQCYWQVELAFELLKHLSLWQWQVEQAFSSPLIKLLAAKQALVDYLKS